MQMGGWAGTGCLWGQENREQCTLGCKGFLGVAPRVVVDLTKRWWLIQHRWVERPLADLCPIILHSSAADLSTACPGVRGRLVQVALPSLCMLWGCSWVPHRPPNQERHQAKARPLPKAEVTTCAFRCSAAALGREEQHQCTALEVAWFPVCMRWMWAPGLSLFLQVLLCPGKPLPRPAVRLCARSPAETHVRPCSAAKG